MRIGLITRNFRHSSRPSADRELLREVLESLTARGFDVRKLRLADLALFPPVTSNPYLKTVVSMTRSAIALDLLEAWVNLGSKVVNSPRGVRSILNRPVLFSRLSANGVKIPATGWVLTTQSPAAGWVRKNAWASHNAFAQNGFHARRLGATGRDWVLVQKALGSLPTTKLYSIGGDLVVPEATSLDYAEQLHARRLVAKCRDITKADIFGLDLIWAEDGPTVIDVNDFPCFAGVAGAADNIADAVIAQTGRMRAGDS